MLQSAHLMVLASGMLLALAAQAGEPKTWQTEMMTIEANHVRIRAGYYQESATVPFRGNVLYLEGLGDSMLNHAPLFDRLSDEGYRVVAFDYAGQGGSEGTMNDTRILNFNPLSSALTIAGIADLVWSRFARDPAEFPRKAVIGWSTGGLAAYGMAADARADAVVLIAPGLVPRKIVGKAGFITLDTLTSAVYGKSDYNPHLDPIQPKTPLLVPLFAANILASSEVLRLRKVPAKVPGLVFFGGDDRYVLTHDGLLTTGSLETVRRRAPHFAIQEYPKARHEVHNEVPAIQLDLIERTVQFLNSP